MATTMPWGETVTVLMELGFPVNYFTLNDAVLGVLGGEGRLDGTLLGDDVAPYIQELSVSRGRPDQLQNFNAGSAQIVLNNEDRRFDPINEDSPYWDVTTGKSGVTPRRKVTVSLDGVDVFVGRITDIDVSYEPHNPSATQENSKVTITAADDFVLLANTYVTSDLTPTEELSGTRVGAILDLPEVDYPATRNISAGTATLGGGATFLIDANTNVLDYLQQVATAEQGYFFVAANGDLTFTDRITASFAGSSATFTDSGVGLPYTGLSTIYGQEFLYNKVVASIINGTEQVANDAASQTEYGISTLSFNNLLLSTNTAASDLASTLLNRYSEPQYRFDRLQFVYNGKSQADRLEVTNLELSDIVDITRTFATGSPGSVTKNYSIEGLRHMITGSEHRIEIMLAVADLIYAFILDDATYGVMDADNALT